jgi:16S rRNA (guanine1207-N2)-methyltransferase
MESLKRLNHISKIVNEGYPTHSKLNSSTLIINYLEVTDLRSVSLPNINYVSKFRHQIVTARQMGIPTSLERKQEYDIVIVSISKSKNESFALIATGYERTNCGGILIVEGNKSNGIDSVIQQLAKFHPLENIISKAHGKIVVLRVLLKKVNMFKEWLAFNVESKNEDGFYSLPGLFSYQRADSASKFLATFFDHKLDGDIIDLGAGWGFLSSKLIDKSLKLKSVTLVDHDQKAIDCAKKNILSSKAIFKWMDITEMNKFESRFDNAICNPPFHSSSKINIQLGRAFIQAAHYTLKHAGNLFLVSNIQLPYESLIDSLFNDFKIAAQNKYFKIILAKRPKKIYNR